MSESYMKKSKEPVQAGKDNGGSSKVAGGRVEGSSGVCMKLRSCSVTGTGYVEGGGSLVPTRITSATGMDSLLHGPEDPVIARGRLQSLR